jgi:uncharacterized membrane protein (UPF0127 family)
VKIVHIFIGALLLAGLIYFTLDYFAPKQDMVCFDNTCFHVELAVTPEERTRGLMQRNYLGPDKGMLFIFENEGDYPFWMKNTSIPLDIIWISGNKEVVAINRNSRPCGENPCLLMSPGRKSRYVLEINAGLSQKINLKMGEQVKFVNLNVSSNVLYGNSTK